MIDIDAMNKELADKPFPKVTIVDDYDPESTAMLQAFYSRSAKPIIERLEELGNDTEQVKEAMQRVYIGYGHASVGDCGSTTIFFENISQIAVKAIQDNGLYSGQESSTRYIDYTKQPFVSGDNPDVDRVAQKWLDFYNYYLPPIVAGLRKQYEREPQEDHKIWEKAIKARAFDIMRGFLPAGTCTQASWHTNLRQARERLRLLVNHPLEEVRDLAVTTLKALHAKYPSSFKATDIEQNDVVKKHAGSYFYPCNDIHQLETRNGKEPEGTDSYFEIDFVGLKEGSKALELLRDREPNTRLPRALEALGKVSIKFPIDFGSWRDVQRHRNGVCPVPMLKADTLEIQDWYITEAAKALTYVHYDECPSDFNDRPEKNLVMMFKADLQELAGQTQDTWSKVNKDSIETQALAQYMVPMGKTVPCLLQYSLPQLLYVLELRSSQHVHPTLRFPMLDIGSRIEKAMQNNEFPEFPLYLDKTEDRWSINRGYQDIVEQVDE